MRRTAPHRQPLARAACAHAPHRVPSLRRRGLKVLIALLLIASGIWTLYLVASHGGHLLQRSLPVPGEAPASMPMQGGPMEGHSHHG